MPSVRSLRTAEAQMAGADVVADAAAIVAERYRQQLIGALAPAMEIQRRRLNASITGILAPAMEAHRRQLNASITGILAPAMEAHRRQLNAMATGILAAAHVQSARVAPGSVQTSPPSMTWPPARQLILHAMMTAVIAALVVAYMDAKLASDPEEALLNLLFAIGFWYQLHCELWK